MRTRIDRRYVVYVYLPADGGKWVLSASFSSMVAAMDYIETMRKQVDTRFEIKAAGPPD